MAPHDLLPGDLADRIEAATNARILAVRPRGGGGASRQGAEIDLRWPDESTSSAYLNHDVHRAGAGDDDAFAREAAILRALSGPLAESGVRTARFHAALPERRALICGLVSGHDRFAAITDEAQKLAVARDFMAQLARLHGIDISRHPVDGMGAITPAATQIRQRLRRLRAANQQRQDPLIHLALDWLEANVPGDLPDPVIVHGDAGPGNFLYAGDQVTALLDWELVHYGDPMADLAMLSIRMLFQNFIPLPAAFAAYVEAGGFPIDLRRIRYWRLLFQTGFAGRGQRLDPDAPPPPNLGMNLVYATIHRRVLSEALAEAAGIVLPAVILPEVSPPRHDHSFAIALDDIRDSIVPRVKDQQAAVKAKGLARLVKWWRAINRFGAAFDAVGTAEIATILGQELTDHSTAWQAFCSAVSSNSLAFETALGVVHAHEIRDAALMADAMGRLAHTRFPPLE